MRFREFLYREFLCWIGCLDVVVAETSFDATFWESTSPATAFFNGSFCVSTLQATEFFTKILFLRKQVRGHGNGLCDVPVLHSRVVGARRATNF